MRTWCWSVLAAVGVCVGGAMASPPSKPEPRSVSLKLADASCNPEETWKCLCVGTAGAAEPKLQEIGVDVAALQKEGWPCVPGDFDADGQPDYAFPGQGYSCNGSVPVRVVFTRGGKVRTVSELPRKLSCLQRYGIRSTIGRHDTPPTSRQGLVDWGEGNATWVYLFDGKTWSARSYASESN